MWQTKLNTPVLTSDLIPRPLLSQKLESKSEVPLILVSAPAGYGKSVLISQWITEKEVVHAWISLDESMNDTANFLKYLGKSINTCTSQSREVLKNLDKEYNFLSWEAIIEKIINSVDELEQKTKLILDDYHLIRNQEIHQLVQAMINEKVKNLQVIIICRWDPPLHLQKLRLYNKILEIRMSDLKFEEEELTDFMKFKDNISLTNNEIQNLVKRTEGWILAIRMILLAKSFPTMSNKKIDVEFQAKDLDQLMSYISESLEPDFFRQMQLCSLCNQFNVELIDSICSFAFEGSCKGEVFLAKLKELNLFIIASKDDGEWYRFHNLFGEILKRQLKKSQPDSIIPFYRHISSWFAAKGLIYEAIQYAIKGEDFELASSLIIEHKAGFLNKGEWWEIKRWIECIPDDIRKSNADVLLTKLTVAEESYEFNEVSYILDVLESLDIENTETKNYSQYLYHLGYYLTFLNPNPEKALEALERSKVLYKDESVFFGGRRELLLAVARQMLGKAAEALEILDDIDRSYKYASIMHLRSLHARVFVYMLSGQLSLAITTSEKFHFLANQVKLHFLEGNAYYLLGNTAFQTLKKHKSQQAFKEILGYEGTLNFRVFFDGLAGLTILNALNDDNQSMESNLNLIKRIGLKMKNPMFQLQERSVRARVHLIKGQGQKELDWAQTDWVEQSSERYFFLIDVPALTKIRILVNHGSIYQVKEALNVLAEVEAFLDKFHNRYHTIDIEFLKAMALFRLGNTARAKKFLEKALLLAEESSSIRPVLEAYKVLPTLFNILDHSTPYRILTRIDFVFTNQNSPIKSLSDSNELSFRERELINLVAKGFINKQIAEQLHISTLTVKKHLSNIYNKLEVRNRTSMLNKIKNQKITFML